MVVGVGGVVVTTLVFGFAGSWVFLYPLPFSSAGQWGDLVTAVFSASVLLVGAGDHLLVRRDHRDRDRPRAGVGPLGLQPPRAPPSASASCGRKRFPSARPVPYPVIPLTVIAIDMIIATLPLAVLLVEMIIQSFWPSVSVDPLLAKNVLWWFGHPVVYLLLFPAVAIYYLLVPRYAKRPLVAGNIIAVGWTIAVIANVTVWAHHLYLDYPNGIQAAINTGMEPITFALTIVSALSLYSLGMTIFRSRWTWNAASTRPVPGPGELAAGRAVGRGQRHHRLGRLRPQHAVDRGPLPPHGAAQHRHRHLRRRSTPSCPTCSASRSTATAWACGTSS